MSKIKILIADNSFLIRQGFHSIINGNNDFVFAGEAEKAEDLCEKLLLNKPHVLVIDYASSFFCIDDISVIHEKFSLVNILAITHPQSKATISKAVESGVMSHLLKDCGKDEIIEAIYATAKGEKFFCGKIVDTVLKNNTSSDGISCEGIKLSAREVEIIKLVAEGFTNKQIADKLFISAHTVMTHRKNIMAKLGVNNTAGLVMFAIRQELVGPNRFLFAN